MKKVIVIATCIFCTMVGRAQLTDSVLSVGHLADTGYYFGYLSGRLYTGPVYSDSTSTVTTKGIVQYYQITEGIIQMRTVFATRETTSKYKYEEIGCPVSPNGWLNLSLCYGWHIVSSSEKIYMGKISFPSDKWYNFIPLNQCF